MNEGVQQAVAPGERRAGDPPRPSPAPPPPPRSFLRAHPVAIIAILLAIGGFVAGDYELGQKQVEYEAEIGRLRQGMSTVERRRADVAFATNKDKLRLIVELARRQAMGDRELHLSILLNRGEMSLEREGVQLRRMPVRIGPEADIGDAGHTIHIVAPRGERTVTAVSPWRITLDGGTTIYADSTREVLADTSAATAGNVRVGATDFGAILPDIKPGMSVYFY